MNRLTEIKFNDIFLIPNLLTIFRILLLIPLSIYIFEDSPRGILLSAIIMVVAGYSDFFDGFLARKLNQRSRLGIYLDPLADKIMTVSLIIVLIFARDFPIWLASIIFIRDLAILAGSRFYKLKSDQVPQSLLPGKYYFASAATLIASYIVNFQFGIKLFTPLVLVFYIWSSFSYGRVMYFIKKSGEPPVFEDRAILKAIRIVLSSSISFWFLYRLYFDVAVFYIP